MSPRIPDQNRHQAWWDARQSRQAAQRLESIEADETSIHITEEVEMEPSYPLSLITIRPTGWWKLRNGNFIRIQDMTLSHLQNVIGMLRARGRTHQALSELQQEVSRRELIRQQELIIQREEEQREQRLSNQNAMAVERMRAMSQQIAREQMMSQTVQASEADLASLQQIAARRYFEQMVGERMSNIWVNRQEPPPIEEPRPEIDPNKPRRIKS